MPATIYPYPSVTATDQSGERTLSDADFHAALRAEELLPLAVLSLALARRALAYDLPRYGVPHVVYEWARVAQVLLADPSAQHPIHGDKQRARQWAIRALRAQDDGLYDAAVWRAETAARTAIVAIENQPLTEDEQTELAEVVTRRVLSAFLVSLDHGVEMKG